MDWDIAQVASTFLLGQRRGGAKYQSSQRRPFLLAIPVFLHRSPFLLFFQRLCSVALSNHPDVYARCISLRSVFPQ